MESNKLKIMFLIIPGLVAIIGNVIFYLIVKNKVDKSIEKFKISYSGLFREKIEIHKEILKQIIEIKFKLEEFEYFENQKIGQELYSDFKTFKKYYLSNQVFFK